MLKPAMSDLMKRVGNRYLLVNLAAQRARDLSEDAQENGIPLADKAVKLALDEIAAGTIVYKAGPREEESAASHIGHDLGGALDLDFDDEVLAEDLDEEAENTETEGE